jgi:hypothetical protein
VQVPTLCQSVYEQLLVRYEQAVVASSQKITGECEDAGHAILWLTARYVDQVGDLGRRIIPAVRSRLDGHPSAFWCHLLPLDCASYVLTWDERFLAIALPNLAHHKRVLRTYCF